MSSYSIDHKDFQSRACEERAEEEIENRFKVHSNFTREHRDALNITGMIKKEDKLRNKRELSTLFRRLVFAYVMYVLYGDKKMKQK